MNFINQVKTPIHRTIYKTDVELFQMMLNEQKSNLKYYIDNRQLVMVAIGILNRTFNLEDYLVAVVGQNWRFRKGVKVGETISVDYQICENNTLTKKSCIYDIHIEVLADDHPVAEGIWSIMLNSKL
ncbi:MULTISPECIES: hypothetical protein [Psychrobacillus]|uniref:MaoC-like domain-containing protein n=1 Tax=Psychrobacillus faecigallinarum TaxID=2762235 RepID=A0ABR8R656_9BACI|nr:hypothetical protein [Psychrobacillus faecigallinarum]MBD7943276.1 hypothetical protein [Psychrobacillus faecigallinarum]QGM31238.1 hypothetical protein GI482_12950 [Bacillus sp. N3536]